ncbi:MULTISPECIES: DUF6668 family protein [unclassified Streptomyces]|uniref:DUF6668 family protein n=1 Tax=unclassified Streptomyces TaxID=2593676 RepID=UPI0022571D80|nr:MULTISPECIES: DUF6668 family protein [unclassified Streptomyces]MCX4882896.1 hypothetical protein [Streptomyces sp. NBC_00847]MCX5422943.1 hypothetical protein [Streptomyces sp. NBC_00078]
MRTDVQQGPEIWIRGPVTVPEPGHSEPAHSAATARHYSWVGTHGGAGVSTLTTVYGGHDCGRDWPGPEAPRSVLLVARTHASGLAAVLRALELFRLGQAPPGLDLDAVVLVADAPGRLPRPLEKQVRQIESHIDVYRVPWVPDWRLGDLNGTPPRETAALARLTGATTRHR